MTCQVLGLRLKIQEFRRSQVTPRIFTHLQIYMITTTATNNQSNGSFYLLSNYYALDSSTHAFTPYNGSVTQALFLFSFYRRGDGVIEHLNT